MISEQAMQQFDFLDEKLQSFQGVIYRGKKRIF